MVIDSMDCLFQKLPDLRSAYDEKFKDNSDSRRKFISGCHVLREPDLDTWILMVLSKTEKHSDSLKRNINSLAGEPLSKKPATEAAKSFTRRQEDPPSIY